MWFSKKDKNEKPSCSCGMNLDAAIEKAKEEVKNSCCDQDNENSSCCSKKD